MIRQFHFAEGEARHLLFMNGGLSHVDTFDPKPMLDSTTASRRQVGRCRVAQTGNLMKSLFKFNRMASAGRDEELWPHLGTVADDLCVVRSMWAEIPNHEPSITLMNTGANFIGRPSMGSWITYGLGSMNQNLPAYVVLTPTEPLTVGSPLWSSAFLPAVHQGTLVHNQWVEDEKFQAEKVIPNIVRASSRDAQVRDLQFLGELNGRHMKRLNDQDSNLDALDQDDGDGVSHADRGAGRVRRQQGEQGDTRHVRPGQHGARLPDLRAPGGKRRPHGADLLRERRSVGRPQRHPDVQEARERLGSGLRGADQGPETARAVRGHARRGRTEFGRTPAIQTTTRMPLGRQRPRSNATGFSIWLAGGGIKGAAYGPPTTSGSRRWRRRSTPRPARRCCFCSASITRS